MASFCMLASKQIRDFWKKMWDETKMERFGINQQKHLSATVRHSRIRCCNSVQRAVHKCKPTNLNELKQRFWNNASETTCQFLRNDVKSYRKPFFKLLRRLLYNPLDHRVYFVYSILVLRQKHLFSHHCTCIWSSLLLCCWIGYTQSW